MPRLSLYKPERGNDYKFFNNRIHEMFTIGGVDVHIHKYLGPLGTPSPYTTPDQPAGPLTKISIQDLLLLENRDRLYDESIYTMRTIYRVNDNDFDLTQFGLFLTGDTMFAVFHLTDMVEMLGRKLMVGDVLELPNLKEFYPLDDNITTALKRFYVVNDATRAAEGFAPTYYPHLWRVKLQPLVDSQEYKDIIDRIDQENADNGDNQGIIPGVPGGESGGNEDIGGIFDKLNEINDAVIERAEEDVPKSGYDTTNLYTQSVNSQGYPGDPGNISTYASANVGVSSNAYASGSIITPADKVEGYLTGDALPPNGMSVKAGIAFPTSPTKGDFFLRNDYVPNRLFRFDSKRWVKIEDDVRTSLTPGAGKTQLSNFVNNSDKRYYNAFAYDAIRVSNVYVAPASAQTISLALVHNTISDTYSNAQVITKTTYKSTIGVKASINGLVMSDDTVIANTGGNIAFTITSNIALQSLLEYTLYANVEVQRVGLSQVLKPLADN